MRSQIFKYFSRYVIKQIQIDLLLQALVSNFLTERTIDYISTRRLKWPRARRRIIRFTLLSVIDTNYPLLRYKNGLHSSELNVYLVAPTRSLIRINDSNMLVTQTLRASKNPTYNVHYYRVLY